MHSPQFDHVDDSWRAASSRYPARAPSQPQGSDYMSRGLSSSAADELEEPGSGAGAARRAPQAALHQPGHGRDVLHCGRTSHSVNYGLAGASAMPKLCHTVTADVPEESSSGPCEWLRMADRFAESGGVAGAAQRAPRPAQLRPVHGRGDFHDGQTGYRVDYGPANWGQSNRQPADYEDHHGTHHTHATRAAPRRPAPAQPRPMINIEMQHSDVSIGSVCQSHGRAGSRAGSPAGCIPKHCPTAAGLWHEGQQYQDVALAAVLRELITQLRQHMHYFSDSHKLPKPVNDGTVRALKLAVNGGQAHLAMAGMARHNL